MHKPKTAGVIPARYSSVRLPGKPLKMINGKSMIMRVVEQAEKSQMLDDVIVATDDKRIFDHIVEHGKKAVMTDVSIRTGTDRCFAAVKDSDYDIIVNIQGDEPLLNPATVDALVKGLLEDDLSVCATPVKKVSGTEAAGNVNLVKAVVDNNGHAMYFSRSPIPFSKDDEPEFYKHIGIYAYRADFLKTFVNMESTSLERSESLEQLRILQNGFKIRCIEVNDDSIGVDTPQDLEKVNGIAISIEGRK
ncbi:MAG: 3-deoxy-manno-octulosonate cytidylyltransferase [Candidatus Delongbacteria bacterium]|nr:3-deoxy-manno-octulosonate cytidylyltransferase [Candidatus Delongbacteria bacterium]